MAFTQRHLLGLEGVSADEIITMLDTAESFKEISERDIKKVPTLRGKTVINLFYEASTRTRTSFEIAAKRLSADTINVSASTSSTCKGETLADTARNLEAMRPDAIVVRHPSSGACHLLARHVGVPFGMLGVLGVDVAGVARPLADHDRVQPLAQETVAPDDVSGRRRDGPALGLGPGGPLRIREDVHQPGQIRDRLLEIVRQSVRALPHADAPAPAEIHQS